MSFASNHPTRRAEAKVMGRADLTRRLVARLKHEEAVIGGIGYANFDLWGAGHRPQNFYMLGSMGLAVPIALGVAIAQPQRRVVALEGDGSILMQLGALATVAGRRPANLIIVIWDNGAYQITGGQPTAAAEVADLVAIARGVGDRAKRLGGGRGRFRGDDRPRAGRGRAVADRLPDRQRQAGRDDGARSGADPRPVHARDRGDRVGGSEGRPRRVPAWALSGSARGCEALPGQRLRHRPQGRRRGGFPRAIEVAGTDRNVIAPPGVAPGAMRRTTAAAAGRSGRNGRDRWSRTGA